METNEITFDEYIDMIRRNFATLSSTWNAQEKEHARKVAVAASELLAAYLERF